MAFSSILHFNNGVKKLFGQLKTNFGLHKILEWHITLKWIKHLYVRSEKLSKTGTVKLNKKLGVFLLLQGKKLSYVLTILPT